MKVFLLLGFQKAGHEKPWPHRTIVCGSSSNSLQCLVYSIPSKSSRYFFYSDCTNRVFAGGFQQSGKIIFFINLQKAALNFFIDAFCYKTCKKGKQHGAVMFAGCFWKSEADGGLGGICEVTFSIRKTVVVRPSFFQV